MERNPNIEFLKKINIYCADICGFTDNFNYTFDDLLNDRKNLYAVSFAILQIGELVKHLTEDFQTKTKETISWKSIKGMRNYFVHGYEQMDPELIWRTAINDIPILQTFCEETIKSE
ncbi:MAG: DUF86 domain-containing protein [Ruminococcus sp.]|jgi:uncharacterized protein with HEPN domain|nr:DUF86 domain-containing protein [Ruminococcus sp.]